MCFAFNKNGAKRIEKYFVKMVLQNFHHKKLNNIMRDNEEKPAGINEQKLTSI
jgi:hypothetical protein